MLAISRCCELPHISEAAATCIQYKGYKRAHDGDPPLELSSPNAKWCKRSHDGSVSWGLHVKYRTADGGHKEKHMTPHYFEDRSAGHARTCAPTCARAVLAHVTVYPI